MVTSPSPSSTETPSPASSPYPHSGFPITVLSNQKAKIDSVLHAFVTAKDPRGYQEKVFINLTQYNPGPSIYLRHAIDGPLFRLIAHIITQRQWGRAITENVLGKASCTIKPHPSVPNAQYYQWVEYKGGDDRKQGRVISRILLIQYDTTPGHQYPWTLRLDEGPGKKSPTGAVMPDKSATADQKTTAQMALSPVQMETWMHLGLEALQSLTTVQLSRHPAMRLAP